MMKLGFKKQLSCFPLRFFVEQLGEQKKIVFTGIYHDMHVIIIVKL
jgi:hypothetical protein